MRRKDMIHNPITAERLRKLRERNRFTQQRIADVLGYQSTQMIYKIEHGERGIPPDRLEVLSKFYGVPYGYLTGEHDYETPEDEYNAKLDNALDVLAELFKKNQEDEEEEHVKSLIRFFFVYMGVDMKPIAGAEDSVLFVQRDGQSASFKVDELNQMLVLMRTFIKLQICSKLKKAGGGDNVQ